MAGITITADSATEFTANAAEYNSSCRLDDNTFVVAYRDENDFNYGKAIVGTRDILAVTISEANAVTFASADIEAITVRTLSATKIIITYYDKTATLSKAIAGTISGTTITFGTAVTVGSHDKYSALAVLDSSNIVISLPDAAADDLLCYVASISGTTISVGSVQTLLQAAPVDFDVIASVGLDSTHCVIAFEQDANGDAKLVIALVDTGAQTITFGAVTDTNLGDPTGKPQMEIFIDKFDSTHFLLGAIASPSGAEIFLLAGTYDTSTLAITIGTEIDTSANGVDFSLCTMGASNFLVSWYTTTGTQAEVRSGTLTGSVDIAWDAQGAQVFDNSTSAYTTLCRLTDNYFLLGYKKG